MSSNKFKGMCAKCKKRKICKVPCAFVEKYLKHDNRKPFERDIEDGKTILYPHWREVHESVLTYEYDDSGKPKHSNVFSTESESPYQRHIISVH
jgi:hypothetical protein